jgi:hypothetical protein
MNFRLAKLKQDSAESVRQFRETGLRWSYIINGSMVVIGVIVNFFLPHGWVIWPLVMAIGIMLMINEAADRNGEGVPPMHVYAWFASALCLWISMAAIFSAIAKPLLIVGLPVGIFFGTRTYLRNKKKLAIATERRAKGLCVACGHPMNMDIGCCENCGAEIRPEVSFLERLRNNNRSTEQMARTRETLTRTPPTIAAQRKEQQLLSRRRKEKPQPPKK